MMPSTANNGVLFHWKPQVPLKTCDRKRGPTVVNKVSASLLSIIVDDNERTGAGVRRSPEPQRLDPRDVTEIRNRERKLQVTTERFHRKVHRHREHPAAISQRR